MPVIATQQPVLSPQAETILEHRYYLKNKHGEIVEDSTALFRRVSDAIAIVDKKI